MEFKPKSLEVTDIPGLGIAGWGLLVELAISLGASDYCNEIEPKTGKQIAQHLGCNGWRVGHLRYLKYAYESGRFHVKHTGID